MRWLNEQIPRQEQEMKGEFAVAITTAPFVTQNLIGRTQQGFAVRFPDC